MGVIFLSTLNKMGKRVKKEMVDLKGYFESYITARPLMLNKKVLQNNYAPEDIPHRDEQKEYVAAILRSCLKIEKPSNLFVYGKTGTGKTLVIKHVTNKLQEVAKQKNLPIQFVYINCKLKRVADTEYRLIAQIYREMGENIPATGLPTDEVYKIFLRHIDSEKKIIILILDEIDQLVKKAGDEILYNLTRINSELKNAQLSIIGISNDLMFMDHVDPRIKSSLGEEEILFPPYDALQIKDILMKRCQEGFAEGVVLSGVIEKCAAYAAREHGDARRAIDLMRVAGEVAERKNKKIVDIGDIDEAEDKIEKDKVLEMVSTQPKQFQLTLFSIFLISEKTTGPVFTGDIYDVYKDLSAKVGLKPLTQRRISDIIAELDMYGIINAKVISKGRYGRTREISLAIPSTNIPNIKNTLKEGLNL